MSRRDSASFSTCSTKGSSPRRSTMNMRDAFGMKSSVGRHEPTRPCKKRAGRRVPLTRKEPGLHSMTCSRTNSPRALGAVGGVAEDHSHLPEPRRPGNAHRAPRARPHRARQRGKSRAQQRPGHGCRRVSLLRPTRRTPREGEPMTSACHRTPPLMSPRRGRRPGQRVVADPKCRPNSAMSERSPM